MCPLHSMFTRIRHVEKVSYSLVLNGGACLIVVNLKLN